MLSANLCTLNVKVHKNVKKELGLKKVYRNLTSTMDKKPEFSNYKLQAVESIPKVVVSDNYFVKHFQNS